jgi:hypothetical protein
VRRSEGGPVKRMVAMAEEEIGHLVRGLRQRGAGDGRYSEVYRFLRRQYEALVAQFDKSWPGWGAVAAELGAVGLLGKKGQPLSGDALRRIWRRVCRDVEAEKEAAAARRPKRHYPSRVSPDWRPPIVEPAALAVAASSPAPYDPDEQIARLKRIIHSRSGRPV